MPPVQGKLKLCENGYHGARDSEVLIWLGPRTFEMEYRGEYLEGDNKVAYREVRLLRELLVLNNAYMHRFAQWCADRVERIAKEPIPVGLSPFQIHLRRCAQSAATSAKDSRNRLPAYEGAWRTAQHACMAVGWMAAAVLNEEEAKPFTHGDRWDDYGEDSREDAYAAEKRAQYEKFTEALRI